jgi:hypothetical protein
MVITQISESLLVQYRCYSLPPPEICLPGKQILQKGPALNVDSRVSASGRNVSDRPGSGADPSDGEKSPRGDCAAAGTIPCFCFFRRAS